MKLKILFISMLLVMCSAVFAQISPTASEQQQLSGYELISERTPYLIGTIVNNEQLVFYNMNYSPLKINLYAKPFGSSFLYKALIIDTRSNYKFRGIVNLSKNPDKYISGWNDKEPLEPYRPIDLTGMHLKGRYLNSVLVWIQTPL